MKELSIEEKAKAYDRALANAKEQAIDGYLDAVAVNDIFPELAENEDEIRKAVIDAVETLSDSPLKVKMLAWLEKHVEQKAEWSKEDERDFDVIYGIIYNSCNAEDASRLIEWLKSLRPQSTWKPSDEQMEALNDVISSRDIKYDVLSELWKDLKNLKE